MHLWMQIGLGLLFVVVLTASILGWVERDRGRY